MSTEHQTIAKCERCGLPLAEVDAYGERMRGCVGCEQRCLPDEDIAANVVDLAVGVIIGVAFGAIVTSLVDDIIMPIIGAIIGGLDFSNYYTPLSSKVEPSLAYVDAKKQGAVLGWGRFLTVTLNFIIIGGVLFLAIKAINELKKEESPDSFRAEAGG